MSDLEAVLDRIDADLDQAIERLFATLRLKSISTDPAYAAATRACAEWHAADLASIGFEASVRDTAGHPMVVGHDRSAAGTSLLFYGHYDVQPVDPLELWEHDPFEPRIVTRADGSKMIVARGSSDDKGQLMTFVEACRAWKAVTGALPLPMTILLEGEEESGGENLPPFLDANIEELRADLALICDTSMWDARTPAITTSLRGLCGEEIIIRGADRDLHSGFYGSAAANPNHVLARILADLRDGEGRVTLPGFYDGVPELPESLRASWAKLDFDPDAFLGEVGLAQPAGEKGRSVLEQTWSRPTAEVNGMGGGYQGEGFKTVIPAEASAKISFRLVFDQDPHKIRAAFRDFVKARIPSDCSVEFIEHGSGTAVAFDTDAPAFQKTQAALTDEWGRDAAFMGGGGSIPVTTLLKERLGIDVVMVGFGLTDDRIHSPNEKYDLQSFHKGIRSWARILAAL
ncbi:MAG: M20/M25/M40 family metallo-hydrolase [Rhodobacteraceae bacterium]|uniref:M20/M25/M40 family metallo-hydrolase n=1 Tax=Amaricoccus sp. TaxID=1872485 RepID=UPI001DC389C7|nr:M20/M25/M40 family metallo-hydrolase [Amaricoccus sp.]MCB1374123.1 M20/M25/M40 family metallo-hydrolase [Paracoccaceae bacterium]MCB1402764.1 M20/M25/M40 family metallo-hydrolase [Paracoccaceae bacterium]MCC0066816.1 M20/M25/M40 family metallo-hydrolase [Rhodovulum sp.]HRW15506.1 M20/M25/M40 family metallo-hydrolase [Amaricoccus sp.]